MYTDYRMIDENVKDYKKYESIIESIKHRFSTYGYERIKTSAFEQYDLYSQVTGSINQREMIKIIDYTGEVLVLRPDVTIPITRKLVQDIRELPEELRYYYIQDVYRQPFSQSERIESTQAGVEFFSKSAPETDAEVIALACQTLMDLGFNDVKLEIGDAGFFQELMTSINITKSEQMELKKLIQAKNAVELRPFLNRLNINSHIANAIESIPFLYGNPSDICIKAKEYYVTEEINQKLDHLLKVYDILKMYDLQDKIIMDLGLINHMDYYSDIIFQGFVEHIGEPVLMGGRYDRLGEEFGMSLPAVGFACKIEALERAIGDDWEPNQSAKGVYITYEQNNLKRALKLAHHLRSQGIHVTTSSLAIQETRDNDSYFINIDDASYHVSYHAEKRSFSDVNDLLSTIKGGD